ncbi:MAG: helix-turn-helix transcriptional regulator [Verrucomicrobia bacterium]|nr:helix-turn-helix transcriptional regulator [Verrucomicrobiota bacterium]MDE3099929.1 helix-turn-helix transcriptional regulator [Verrucomicrobiota bacterium]
MAVECPLIIRNATLPPAGEWSPQLRGWTVVRVAEGSGYCLCSGGVRELQQGDGFMAPHTTAVTVRASRLGSMHLQFFQVQPELLGGLLTVAESWRLQTLPAHSPYISFFKIGESSGQKFSQLAARSNCRTLAMRSALFQIWADGVMDVVGNSAGSGSGAGKLKDRFRELIGTLPEVELMSRSAADLSRQLNCCERHFRHLFQQQFKMPFRNHQTELRLMRAARLLADSGARIDAISRESGYKHPRLFSVAFRKRFDMTPTEWRRRHAGP